MADLTTAKALNKLFIALGALLFIVSAGTGGYWLVSEGSHSLLDCLYMTIITVTTIGYGEIIDLSGSPAGRVFTMLLAASGIGVMTYILVNVTAFVVEGQLNETFRRRKMEKKVREMKGHFIVCGLAGTSRYILQELQSTGRPHVLIVQDLGEIDRSREEEKDLLCIEGDITDSDTLIRAGIERARGLFAVTGDDNQNLVISLTARELNPEVRVIASCEIMKGAERMKKAGADAVVSPTYIGGLRMASEMLRPSVVSFLDVMLRQDGADLRIEELSVPGRLAGRPISNLNLGRFDHLLLLALRTDAGWHYNPPREQVLKEGDTLIFMTSTGERQELENLFSSRD